MKSVQCIILTFIFVTLCCSCDLATQIPEFEFKLNDEGSGYILTKYYETSSSAKTDVVIPETYNDLPVTEIGSNAFIGCSKIISIYIPDSITCIGGNAFMNCTKLKTITIPKTVNRIQSNTFEGCESLEYIEVSHCISVGWEAFKGCTNLKTVVLGNKTENGDFLIDEYAFYKCTNLETVKLGKCYVQIGDNAFAYCVNLTSIYLSNNLTDIKSCAFEHCEKLRDIYFDGTEEEWGQVKCWPWWCKDAGDFEYHFEN